MLKTVFQRERLMLSCNFFDWFYSCSDGSREEIFKMAFGEFLNAGLESFIDEVGKIILLFDSCNDPVIHFVGKSFEVASLLFRI